MDAANSSASDVSSFTAQYHHSTTSGDFNLAPPTSQTLSRWASVGRCQRRRAPEPAPCVDDLRAPSPTRRGAQQMVINESSPLPSPGALGRALEAAAQEPPPAVAVHPVSLPTEETLLIWAVTMFLSGTGAVVALQTETGLKEMTVDLCMRIRKVIHDLFTDDSNKAKLPPSGTATLDQEEAMGYLAAAVLGNGLLPPGDGAKVNPARAVGEVVRTSADGAKGTSKKPGPLVTEPKRLALQAARDAKRAGLDEAEAAERARADARLQVLSSVVDLKLERLRVTPPSMDRLEAWCSKRGKVAYGVGGVQYRQALRAARGKWVQETWRLDTYNDREEFAINLKRARMANDLCDCAEFDKDLYPEAARRLAEVRGQRRELLFVCALT